MLIHQRSKKGPGRPAGSTTKLKSKQTAKAKSGKAAAKAKLPAKYRDPKTGATWSGWARPPLWIKDVKDRSKFLISGRSESDAVEASGTKPAGKKAADKESGCEESGSQECSGENGQHEGAEGAGEKSRRQESCGKEGCGEESNRQARVGEEGSGIEEVSGWKE